MRALLPTRAADPPVPAVAMNVAAQLLAVDAGADDDEPASRFHQEAGHWVEVRDARLAAGTATIERISPGRRVETYSRAMRLTRREADVVKQLVIGADTRELARAMGIGEQTVNDHLRVVVPRPASTAGGSRSPTPRADTA